MPLKELSVGQAVRMKLPGSNTWSLGLCRRVLGQRSYNIMEVAGHIYRRNRRQLRSTNELVPIADDQKPAGGDSVTRAPISQQTGKRQPDVVDIPMSPCPRLGTTRGTPRRHERRDEPVTPRDTPRRDEPSARRMTLRNRVDIKPPRLLIDEMWIYYIVLTLRHTTTH